MKRRDIEIEIMRAAGLTDHEIFRLNGLRRRVDAGECDDLTIEHKRLLFVKDLYLRGVMHEWGCDRVEARQVHPPGFPPGLRP